MVECRILLESINFIILKEVKEGYYVCFSVCSQNVDGDAYSRAVRVYTLLKISLSKIIFTELPFTSNEQKFTNVYLKNNNETTHFFSEDEELNISVMWKVNFKINSSKLKERGPTSKFWVQYLDILLILKVFIRVERIGEWKAHMSAIKRIISYSHVAEHFLNAKSSHFFYLRHAKNW